MSSRRAGWRARRHPARPQARDRPRSFPLVEHPRERPLAQQVTRLGAFLDQLAECRNDLAAQLAARLQAAGRIDSELSDEQLARVMNGKAAQHRPAPEERIDARIEALRWDLR